MAVTIEALLEENVGQMQSFLEHLRKLQEYFKSEVQTVDEKFESAEKSFSESIENMSSAKEVIGALDQALRTSEQEVESKLNELEGQYDGIAAKLEAADQSVRQVFTGLDAGADKIQNLLDARWGSSLTELKTIRDAAKNLGELIDSEKDKLGDSSQRYFNRKGAEVEELREQYENMSSGFDSFNEGGKEVMAGAGRTMHRALAEVKQEHETIQKAFSETIKSQIEQAATEEPAKFSEAINGPIGRALEKIQAAKRQVQAAKDDVEAKVSEVGTKAEQVVESMGEAESTLDKIKELL